MSDTTTKARKKSGQVFGGWLGLACSAFLIASGLSLGLGGPVRLASANRTAAAVQTRRDPLALTQQPPTRAIEEIRVGDRIQAGNPDVGKEASEPEVDPSNWRRLELLEIRGGDRIQIVLLRPLSWIEAMGVHVGATVELDLEEMDVAGPAEVLSLGPCPPLTPGPGRVVTGTFTHVSSSVVDVRVVGRAEPIGVTAKHRFYSESRRAFVAAKDLIPGERLRPVQGGSQVASVTPRSGSHRVYNLEVNVEHAYRVSDLGLLVHNQYELNVGSGARPRAGAINMDNFDGPGPFRGVDVKGDALRMPFRDGQFAKVFADNLPSGIAHNRTFASEASRVLESGGKLTVKVRSPLNAQAIFQNLMDAGFSKINIGGGGFTAYK